MVALREYFFFLSETIEVMFSLIQQSLQTTSRRNNDSLMENIFELEIEHSGFLLGQHEHRQMFLILSPTCEFICSLASSNNSTAVANTWDVKETEIVCAIERETRHIKSSSLNYSGMLFERAISEDVLEFHSQNSC